jgi:hypothetical protein
LPEVEVVDLAVLTSAESPEDHRSFALDISTRSLLGVYRYKVCRPVSHRLVTSQESSVKTYNKIIREQFQIHLIEKQMDAVDRMTRYYGYPSPLWLRTMILKLYNQMTEIRVHAKKKCRKILQPNSNFSPMIKMWYDRICTYLQLIRMKEGKTNNTANILSFARHQHINNPKGQTMEELKDGLQYARIRQADLRKQAKGLQKTHPRDCLVDLLEKKQKKHTTAIKQKINREESKRMWYVIKQMVKDHQSPSILKVQQVINGEPHEYNVQEDIENAIQRECEIRFLLAHSAPIMTTLLGEQLDYLSDKELAKSIITRLYKIPSDMDPATKLILEEIGRLGIKLVKEKRMEIIITPDNLKRFWTKDGKFTSSLISGVHYGHYKAAMKCNVSNKIPAQQLTVVA